MGGDLTELDAGGVCLAKTAHEHLEENGAVAGENDFVRGEDRAVIESEVDVDELRIGAVGYSLARLFSHAPIILVFVKLRIFRPTENGQESKERIMETVAGSKGIIPSHRATYQTGPNYRHIQTIP